MKMSEFDRYRLIPRKEGYKRVWKAGFFLEGGVWVMGYWNYRLIPTRTRQKVYTKPNPRQHPQYKINADGSFSRVRIETHFPVDYGEWSFDDEQETWTRKQTTSLNGVLNESTTFLQTPLGAYIEEMEIEVLFVRTGFGGYVHSLDGTIPNGSMIFQLDRGWSRYP